jgi:hypothetical protein
MLLWTEIVLVLFVKSLVEVINDILMFLGTKVRLILQLKGCDDLIHQALVLLGAEEVFEFCFHRRHNLLKNGVNLLEQLHPVSRPQVGECDLLRVLVVDGELASNEALVASGIEVARVEVRYVFVFLLHFQVANAVVHVQQEANEPIQLVETLHVENKSDQPL